MAERTGPGRWCPVRDPKGVLWESATGTGFQPAPGTDSSAVAARLSEGFDALAAELGGKITTGTLDRWEPDQTGRRR